MEVTEHLVTDLRTGYRAPDLFERLAIAARDPTRHEQIKSSGITFSPWNSLGEYMLMVHLNLWEDTTVSRLQEMLEYKWEFYRYVFTLRKLAKIKRNHPYFKQFLPQIISHWGGSYYCDCQITQLLSYLPHWWLRKNAPGAFNRTVCVRDEDGYPSGLSILDDEDLRCKNNNPLSYAIGKCNQTAVVLVQRGVQFLPGHLSSILQNGNMELLRLYFRHEHPSEELRVAVLRVVGSTVINRRMDPEMVTFLVEVGLEAAIQDPRSGLPRLPEELLKKIAQFYCGYGWSSGRSR